MNTPYRKLRDSAQANGILTEFNSEVNNGLYR
jgi:hypothetical protein